MGKFKVPSEKKSKRLDIHLTEAEYEIAQANKEIAGYQSMTKFVRDRICYYYRPKSVKNASGPVKPTVEELQAEVESLQLELARTKKFWEIGEVKNHGNKKGKQ